MLLLYSFKCSSKIGVVNFEENSGKFEVESPEDTNTEHKLVLPFGVIAGVVPPSPEG